MSSISIALASFNGSQYIEEQLRSIIHQTRIPNEIVIFDDCSNDDTVERAERILGSFDGVAVAIHKNDKRLGYRANFMKAAQACSMKYIAFSDQDDLWAEDKLERMIMVMEASNAVLAYHDAHVGDQTLRRVGRLSERPGFIGMDNPQTCDPWFHALGFTQVFNRALLSQSSLQQDIEDHLKAGSQIAHDQWTFAVAPLFGRTVFVDTPLAVYRLHQSNAVGIEKHSLRGAINHFVRDRVPELGASISAAESRRRSASVMLKASGSCGRRLPELASFFESERVLLSLKKELYEAKSLAQRFRSCFAMYASISLRRRSGSLVRFTPVTDTLFGLFRLDIRLRRWRSALADFRAR